MNFDLVLCRIRGYKHHYITSTAFDTWTQNMGGVHF